MRFEAHRAVEAQHQIATRRLVDSDAEQLVLEELIESVKPPPASDAAGRHYLLTTPFRYPPLRHGSRFGSRQERGIWYGATTIETVLAEVAYYRLAFLEGTEAPLGTIDVELSAFTVRIATRRGVDLTVPPFAAHRERISSPTQYRTSQALGSAMRADSVDVARYLSARDPGGGVGVAVFDPGAFADRRPRGVTTWRCVATRERVEFRRRDYFVSEALGFDRRHFLVRGRLPTPAG